ncbi:MAG: Asp-tRNA(Asn)/Glu-tRNA(Gln) amidotransferase subunit GatB, partial [Anaerolineae bacterium]
HNLFARKNYFYPDLPKGYQISQYELPLCRDGFTTITVNDHSRRIGITRVHLEEDTGKLTHVAGGSLVDLNRAGVPLMEIVSEADLTSTEEAYAYVSTLRQLVRYLGVSSGDMEKGAMRCEVNLSLRPAGSTEWGTKVEVKNLNSFRSVRRAIEFEIARQTHLLESGVAVTQVTMGWDENRAETVVQRTKEDAHDYRYFPEPDLPPLHLSEDRLAELRRALPELPDARVARYTTRWGLTAQEAAILTEHRDRANYFEAVVAAGEGKISPKSVSNWMTGEAFRLLNETGLPVTDIKITPADFVRLVELVEGGDINRLSAKEVFARMWQTGDAPDAIVERQGLRQISDAGVLDKIVAQVIAGNPGPAAQFKGGKEKALKFLIGQVMRQTQGKANPQQVEALFRQKL